MSERMVTSATATGEIRFKKTGRSEKGNDWAMWSMPQLGAKRDDGTWYNMAVDCFSMSHTVIGFIAGVSEQSEVITVRGPLELNWYRNKAGTPNVSLRIKVEKAWRGGPNAEPRESAPEPTATPTTKPANQGDDDIPF